VFILSIHFRKRITKVIVLFISSVILLLREASFTFLISSTGPGKVLLLLLFQLQQPGQEMLGVRGKEEKSVLGGILT